MGETLNKHGGTVNVTNRRYAIVKLARCALLCHKVRMTPADYHMWQCLVATHQNIVPMRSGECNA